MRLNRCLNLDLHLFFDNCAALDTGYRLQRIGRIVETGCSPHIAEFMCRLVAPECAPDGLDHPTRPCRPLCEKVKRDCEPVLQENGLNWPRKIQCQDLPEYNCKSVSTFFFFFFLIMYHYPRNNWKRSSQVPTSAYIAPLDGAISRFLLFLVTLKLP